MDDTTVDCATIFLCLAGSRSYGTDTDDSDIDLRGVCLIPLKSLYVGTGSTSFEQKDAWESGEDKVVYDFRKALRLMADGNPNMIDLLYTRPQEVMTIKKPWEEVIENRSRFVSKKMRYTYGGYAFSQLKRIRSHRRFLSNPPSCVPSRAIFGLPESRTISAEDLNAFQWMISKILKDNMDFMHFSETTKSELNQVGYYQFVQQDNFNDGVDAIKKITGAPDEYVDMVVREKQYSSAVRDWIAYGKWRDTKNVRRKNAEYKYGYDTKNAMHLVRLLRMGMEILESGKVEVYRSDHEELKSIRYGAWSYDYVEQYAEECEQKLSALYKICTLPLHADNFFIEKLCTNIIEREVFP